jgi:hypothetical protein
MGTEQRVKRYHVVGLTVTAGYIPTHRHTGTPIYRHTDIQTHADIHPLSHIPYLPGTLARIQTGSEEYFTNENNTSISGYAN